MAYPSPEAAGPTCIANISPRERRRRLAFGVVALAAGLAVLVVLMVAGADRWWRLPLILLYFPAATGYFQWRDQTCVALAARSERKLGRRTERIEDAAELAQVRAQARRVQLKSMAVGIALTAVALLLP